MDLLILRFQQRPADRTTLLEDQTAKSQELLLKLEEEEVGKIKEGQSLIGKVNIDISLIK